MPQLEKRRQRLSAEQRRGQLMAATVQVVSTVGFRGASADAIARQAGLSKGLLWHYYADLDELLEATAVHALDTLRSTVAGAVDLEAPVPEVIRSAIHAVVVTWRSHGPQRRAMQEIVPNLRHPDGTLRLGIQHYESLYEAQTNLIRRGQRDGDIRAALDPRVVAVTYQGAVDALLAYLDAHPDIDPDRYAGQVADLLLSGISTGGTGPHTARW